MRAWASWLALAGSKMYPWRIHYEFDDDPDRVNQKRFGKSNGRRGIGATAPAKMQAT
jgi:hypothetical protein